MNELVAAGTPELFSDHSWLVVAVIAGVVSAVTIVQETRTTSLLLSRWAAFLASIVILLDVATAELVVKLVLGSLSTNDWQNVVRYIAVAAAAPSILRSFRVSAGKASVGPIRPYDVLRGALLIRLDDEFGTQMEMKARLIAGKALEYQIEPEKLAHVMKALAKRGKLSRASKSQIGHILGALRAGSV
jgi:hypothetical protein